MPEVKDILQKTGDSNITSIADVRARFKTIGIDTLEDPKIAPDVGAIGSAVARGANPTEE